MSAERQALDDDSALFARVVAGDITALAALYDRHAAAAYGMACRLLGPGPDAEAAVANAFLVPWRDVPAAHAAVGLDIRSFILRTVRRLALATRAADPDRMTPPSV